MISKQIRIVLFIGMTVLASVFNGCVAINQNLLLDKGTKVEIVDATENALFSSGAANSQQTIEVMTKRIIGLTREELASRNIEAFTTPTPGAAKLKYDIRTVNAGQKIIGTMYGVHTRDKFEVKYRVIFETPDGKRIFIDTDEKDDSDIDNVFEDIASRVAKNVANSFKNDLVR